MMTAGSPPPPTILREFKETTGIDVQTAYGLTETYGPVTLHVSNEDSTKVDNGVVWQCSSTLEEDVTIRDPDTNEEVPEDGETLGEVMIRGNLVMNGYLKNKTATEECFKGGWFRSGDLGVRHKYGRFEIKDRLKDIIISGGENISSIDVQNIMAKHEAIHEVAVIGMSHEKWGEVPCAFTVLENGANIDENTLLSWCRENMPHFYCPKRIEFITELPKTGTGKVQKNILRDILDKK